MKGSKLLQAGALAVAVAMLPFAAGAVGFSGTDSNVQFTAYGSIGVTGTPGVFAFYDSDDPSPARGTVTAEDGVAGLLSGQVDLEMLLDLSGGYDPSTDALVSASFTGTGGNEIIVWDSAGTTALAVFDISFVNVRNANGVGGSNVISFGDPETSETQINSALTLVGGTLAGSLGGAGQIAILDIIFDPTPGLPDDFNPSFLTGYPGFLGNSLTGGVTWAITIVPEPGTGLLLGSALLALGVHGRRQRHR